ncbi:hypothetical protein [Endozoicomonas sp. 8E]|uniref:hypothetical protein n=1 Tax=Endozoicomonas sp. 8E TaxID=3035692 RepID=UPI00293948B5|nr:hypothetical protein [Endozoicomonas sp. 8E]WOG29131.1 hypothetical protein P6910_05555 [Endozoicomonas sp. 8E]
MHVAQTSASPPSTETKIDTQSATASGQWAVRESTCKLLPRHPRECERQELLWAAESGRLAFRRIKWTKEKNYFSGKGAPRPFTLALSGEMMPTERVPEWFGKWMVGIVDPQCLYVYKYNAGTKRLMTESGLTPEKLEIKLLPHLRSLLDRRLERGNQVFWQVYPASFTSGHLRTNGTFSLPKLKPGHFPFSGDFPELVLTHYNKEDIKCICVYKDAQINISDILRDKRECEDALKLKPLPLVVYCQHTGSVQVYFDDELNNSRLTMNERSLDNFAFSQGIAPEHFKAVLNLLPMSLRAEALSSELTISADFRHKLQQAIKLVKNPSSYSYEKLLELKQSGLPIHQHFFHKGVRQSLLEMLVSSEIRRHAWSEHEQTKKQEEEACRLLRLLLQSGARLRGDISKRACMKTFMEPIMPAGVLNYMVAVSAPLDYLTLKHLSRIPLTDCPGGIVEFDRICQRLSQRQLQSSLEKMLHYPHDYNPPTLDNVQCQLLALFRYGAVLKKASIDHFKSHVPGRYHEGERKIIDDFSLQDYIKWLKKLWHQRKKHPFYQNWPEHVWRAQQDIADLKQSLDQDDSGASATALAAKAPAALQFMVDAFSKSPVMPDYVGDNEKTILKVLQHYYRRPGPERVVQSLGRQTMPAVWKPLHSCSHVLRARNNGHWYMELLEKFQLCSLRKQEKELLSLAIIYHDAAAEDVDKSVEESRSADYFKRDLAGHYPEQLLKDMALAMASKENDVKGGDQQNLSESVRWYLRILRFADRMDVIRGCGVGADFPGLTVARTLGFDATRLDLPPQLTRRLTSGSRNKTEFQRHLEAAMHGAADLARVTWPLYDQRKKNYTQVYGLNANGSKISGNFEWTTEPVQRMNQFIDDNVRRKMARKAGMIVCSDPRHRTCKADQNKGVTYGIHNSWYDLGQVAIPARMTLLEKMQYEHDPSLLSPATQKAIEQEVQRLKSEGIQMNLGTLTQKTLASEKAQKVLKQRGIAVVSEKRPYFTDDGLPREWKMLVPKKTASPDAQDNAPEGRACTII